MLNLRGGQLIKKKTQKQTEKETKKNTHWKYKKEKKTKELVKLNEFSIIFGICGSVCLLDIAVAIPVPSVRYWLIQK